MSYHSRLELSSPIATYLFITRIPEHFTDMNNISQQLQNILASFYTGRPRHRLEYFRLFTYSKSHAGLGAKPTHLWCTHSSVMHSYLWFSAITWYLFYLVPSSKWLWMSVLTRLPIWVSLMLQAQTSRPQLSKTGCISGILEGLIVIW